MTSAERIKTVLSGKIPDRVPWFEGYISSTVARALLGRDDFLHSKVVKVFEKPGFIKIPPDIRQVLPVDNIAYDLSPPTFAKVEKLNGIPHLTEGLIKTPADLKLLDGIHDPDDESIYRTLENFITQYKDDSAVSVTVRSGLSNTYLSMGIENFCAKLITDTGFVLEMMERYCQWSLRVIKNVQELDMDFFWMPDDIGFGDAPMVSPDHFRKYCMPVMKKMVEAADRPVIYHSDGNIMPLMDDIISIGYAAVGNLEPGPMDIEEVKALYGDRITLVGNIDLHYTLTRGSAEEAYEETRQRIEHLAPGGRYILASANSLPLYVKPENAAAMGRALLDCGDYGSISRESTARADTKPKKADEKITAHRDEDENPFISSIQQGIIKQQMDDMEDLIDQGLKSGLSAEHIIDFGLIKAMEVVGDLFSNNEIFVPEMMISAICMQKSLEKLQPLIVGNERKSKGIVMLATVKGDLHDIGKNLVATMLKGNGYTVIDLGINITEEEIIREVETQKPDILGLSALLTTTLPAMGECIDAFREAGIRDQVKIIVGGAPVDSKFAQEIGADGYGSDAADAVRVCHSLLS